MKLIKNTQHWILVGTTAASEEIWGLRRIAFPCAYFIPACAFARTGQPVINPAHGKEAWAMGGFAFEVKDDGKNIKKDFAAGLVKGYRPWIALFHNVLIDKLDERKHTIQIWDHGVSIFYGLWQEASQVLGQLILKDDFQGLVDLPLTIESSVGKKVGSPARVYAHSAADIVAFMSDFMTLSAGDIYVLGPLVAQRIVPNEEYLIIAAGDFRFEVQIS
jgi:hypothetical protein